MDVKDLQFKNKLRIFVTWDKLKLDKSNEIYDRQFWNIPVISPLIEEESKWVRSIS